MQLLDVATSLYGFSLGLAEGNPFASSMLRLFIVKFVVVIALAIILQIKKYFKTDWILIAVSGLVIPYNLFLIFVYSVILHTPQIPLDFLIAMW